MSTDTAPGVALTLEREVLGALLLTEGRDTPAVEAVMPAGEYGDWRHEAIAAAIYGLYRQGGPVTPGSVLDALHRAGARVEPVYLVGLLHDAAPAAALELARRARAYALLRRLHAVGERLCGMANVTELEDVPAVVGQAVAQLRQAVAAIEHPPSAAGRRVRPVEGFPARPRRGSSAA